MNDSDHFILSLIKASETKRYGFDVLVKTYQTKMYWVVRRIVISHSDADDVLQDVFLKVWSAINDFKNNSTLYTWLYKVAVNESLMFLRKKRRRFFLPLIDVEKELISELDSSVYFNGDELQLLLQKAVLALPEKQRVVFNLKYYEELKHSEIAEIMNVSEGAIKANYHLAVKKIKENLNLD